MAEEGCSGCSDGTCNQKAENPEEQRLKQNLSRIKHKIVVLSGKGGVGKSTVAVNMAVALAMAGKQVGLMDVDVHGPSVPRLLNLMHERPHMGKDNMEPIPYGTNLWVMSLGFLIPSPKDAVIWRGPVKMGLIKQFIADVTWGKLDYLVVDCPPGTGDEPLSVLQLLGQDAQAVIVTTPQGVAVDDVRRSISFCAQVGNPVLGVVENMSGYACPKCGEVTNIFNSGGGRALAAETKARFLGALPLDPEIVRTGDAGMVFVQTHPKSPTTKAMNEVIQPILDLDK